MGRQSIINPGFKPEGSDLIAVRRLGLMKATEKERGALWEMRCQRVKVQSPPGASAFVIVCGNSRAVLVKRFRKILACKECSEAKRQAGRSNWGNNYSPPAEDRARAATKRPKIGSANFQKWIDLFAQEAAEGRPEALAEFRSYFDKRRETVAAQIEAVEMTLIEFPELCTKGTK